MPVPAYKTPLTLEHPSQSIHQPERQSISYLMTKLELQAAIRRHSLLRSFLLSTMAVAVFSICIANIVFRIPVEI
jgi:hypothetical protein